MDFPCLLSSQVRVNSEELRRTGKHREASEESRPVNQEGAFSRKEWFSWTVRSSTRISVLVMLPAPLAVAQPEQIPDSQFLGVLGLQTHSEALWTGPPLAVGRARARVHREATGPQWAPPLTPVLTCSAGSLVLMCTGSSVCVSSSTPLSHSPVVAFWPSLGLRAQCAVTFRRTDVDKHPCRPWKWAQSCLGKEFWGPRYP